MFKTKSNNLGENRLVLNNPLNLFKDLFKKEDVFSDEDINSLKQYNAEIQRGVSPMTAYYRTMQNASDAAVSMAESANGTCVNLEHLPKKTKASSIAFNAFATIGNMAFNALISYGITKAIEAWDNYANAQENAIKCRSRQKSWMSPCGVFFPEKHTNNGTATTVAVSGKKFKITKV